MYIIYSMLNVSYALIGQVLTDAMYLLVDSIALTGIVHSSSIAGAAARQFEDDSGAADPGVTRER
jgi:hypothetical protein